MEKIITIQKKLSTQNVRMLTMTAGTFCHRLCACFFEFPVPLSPSFCAYGFIGPARTDRSFCIWPCIWHIDPTYQKHFTVTHFLYWRYW